jgi:CBS domain-containing protein
VTQIATTLRDIMSTDVVTVEPDATLRDVAELFAMEGVSGAPVVSDGRVVGVISASDIVDFAASMPRVLPARPPSQQRESRVQHGWEAGTERFYAEYGPPGELLQRYTSDEAAADALREHLVRDLMTAHVLSLPPDTELHEAATFMLENGVHRLIVLEDGEVVGMVSTFDFLRALAERRL